MRPLSKGDIVKVGVTLGLKPNKLKDQTADEIHINMITSWLLKNDNVMESSGTPTLKSLKKALKDNGFGVAEEIDKLCPSRSGSKF